MKTQTPIEILGLSGERISLDEDLSKRLPKKSLLTSVDRLFPEAFDIETRSRGNISRDVTTSEIGGRFIRPIGRFWQETGAICEDGEMGSYHAIVVDLQPEPDQGRLKRTREVAIVIYRDDGTSESYHERQTKKWIGWGTPVILDED